MIYATRQFWFGEKSYSDTSVHKHFHTITFDGEPNVDAQIYLTIFASGAAWGDGGGITALGVAAAGFRSIKYINNNGSPVVEEFDNWRARVRVRRVIEITAAFHVKLAWAKAEGMMFYWD
jgi:hypothetical protein